MEKFSKESPSIKEALSETLKWKIITDGEGKIHYIKYDYKRCNYSNYLML